MYSPIPELNQLKEFYDGPGEWAFSDGFEFYEYNRAEAGLVEWLCLEKRAEEARPFLDRLVPFAQATGSGSFYALWRCDDREDLATLPVIMFGDEGDLDIIGGLRELFRLLALDDEWYLPDAGQEPSDGHAAYVVWLEENFGLRAPDDADEILVPARKQYGEAFVDWLATFVPGEIDLESWRGFFGR